jgi:hypothetical protein
LKLAYQNDSKHTKKKLIFNKKKIDFFKNTVGFISSNWPYWNRTEGADHFFVVPHDFGACFHYQVSKPFPFYLPSPVSLRFR